MQSDTQKNRLARRGLPIIQLMVYKRTIRFNADDRVVYQRMRRKMRLASDNSWARHRLKHLNWRSRWIILYTLEWRMAVSCEISWADRCFWLVLLTDHKVLHCYAPNVVFRCLDAGQLYSSCRFSSADWRCFQVTDPCWAILLTAFVHHTALIRRDF